jgi:hypothetical protein
MDWINALICDKHCNMFNQTPCLLDFRRSPQVMPSIVIVQGQFAVISADGILGKIRSE